MTPAGLEPAIPGSVGRCHWATGPSASVPTQDQIEYERKCALISNLGAPRPADGALCIASECSAGRSSESHATSPGPPRWAQQVMFRYTPGQDRAGDLLTSQPLLDHARDVEALE